MEQRARFSGADRRRNIRGLHHASRLALAAAALAAVACPLRYLLGWLFLVSATLAAMSAGMQPGVAVSPTASQAQIRSLV